MPLTRLQRRLKAEVESIAELIVVDHWNIENYEEAARTSYLRGMKDKLVRAEIITKYTLIDELVTNDICHFYFRSKHGAAFQRLWRTKSFQIFNHYILDEMYLLKKVQILNAIRQIPREVRSAIGRINDLRNAMAHSFFPENRRQYLRLKRVEYQGSDILTREGVEKFVEDAQRVISYFIPGIFEAFTDSDES